VRLYWYETAESPEVVLRCRVIGCTHADLWAVRGDDEWQDHVCLFHLAAYLTTFYVLGAEDWHRFVTLEWLGRVAGEAVA
jgi:hypothetical protein